MRGIIMRHCESLEELQELCTELWRISSTKEQMHLVENEEYVHVIINRDIQYICKEGAENYIEIAEAFIRGFYTGAAEQLRDIHGI